MAVPTAVAVSLDDAYVYVTSASDENSIVIFARNSETGRLTYLGGPAFNGAMRNPQDIAISPDGSSIYVAAYDSNAVAIFQRNPASGALTYRESLIDGENGINTLRSVQSLVVSPNNAHLYVASQGDSTITVFTRDPATSVLTFVETQTNGLNGVTGIAEIQAITISADGKHVYTVSNESALTLFQRNPTTGKLTFQQKLSEGEAGVSGLVGGKALTISQDGANVYVYNKEYSTPTTLTAVTRFQRNPTSGALTFADIYTDTQSFAFGDPVEIFLPADGKQIYTSHVDGLGHFVRDLSNGAPIDLHHCLSYH